MLIDNDARLQATDPHQSFIVQAPAGSGKTEILTQRYLRLLGTVSAPEQIVALTFTRKAANEMRERIVLALQRAAEGIPSKSAHQQKTAEFAAQALRQDHAHDWQLLQQPGRLQILTIDALCQRITQAVPLQDKQLHEMQVSDKPQALYLEAARACLDDAIQTPAYQDALRVLLNHLDNRQDNLLRLFSDLLAKRDQWIDPIYQAMHQDKAIFEGAIASIEHHATERFKQSLPADLANTLVTLAAQLAHIENNPASKRYSLQRLQSITQLDNDIIQGLSALLLTGTNTLRKGFDHHVGLKRGVCPNDIYTSLKADSKALLESLAE
jgi:ATP-dependent exoDNAse (exonuclease V) beta subunit